MLVLVLAINISKLILILLIGLNNGLSLESMIDMLLLLLCCGGHTFDMIMMCSVAGNTNYTIKDTNNLHHFGTL